MAKAQEEAEMADSGKRTRLRTLTRHVGTQYARDRLGRALFEVVVDGLELGPCGIPVAEDRDWLRGALALPLQEATDVALDVLAWRICQILEQAPQPLRDRFDHGHGEELAWAEG